MYPGGWQTSLPNAVTPATVAGAMSGLHGESSLVPWDATVTADGPDAVEVTLSTELTHCPLELERRVRLEAGESAVYTSESATNVGRVGVDYAWLQYVTLGEPLVGPEAELDVGAGTGRTKR